MLRSFKNLFELFKYISCWSTYDSETQITKGMNKIQLIDVNGNNISSTRCYEEHIPTITDLRKWILNAGLRIKYEYGSYNRTPINKETTKAIIWAVKE